MRILQQLLLLCPLVFPPLVARGESFEAEVCVYGGTSGAAVAAVQAARMGKRVVLAQPGRHLGGMTSGGLCAVDIGDPRSVGGIAREYFTRLVASYGKTLDWNKPFQGKGGPATGGAYSIEPHVAEELFDAVTSQAGVIVLRDARLRSVEKRQARIVQLIMQDGRMVRAKVFIDATYEGDLMAASGVGYTLIREGNAKYGETYNGIHYTDKYRPRLDHKQPGANGRVPGGQGVWDRDFPLDPYVVKGDPTSGLLPLINDGDPGQQGEPAAGIQAYCFRLCLTTARDRLPIAPPSDYNAQQYELVARFIEACLAHGDQMDLRWFSKHDPLPNDKWDFNTATFGGNLPGASWEWSEASYDRRAEIANEIENYHRGLLHFLATDPRVPESVRRDMQRFGLPTDEFTDNGGWPHQIYIREGRRMVSDLVMTEHHTFGRQIAPRSIGLGSYGTDTHEIRRIVKAGVVTREGKTATGRGGFGPYKIGYGAIVPKQKECENLLVTFALSASHTALSSIRMEPVFMVTSQSAATAACQAIDDGTAVQQVDYNKLRNQLLADGQVLSWPIGTDASRRQQQDRTQLPPSQPTISVGTSPAAVDGQSYELCVIEATPGGVACSVRAAREGLSVLLVNRTPHLGGILSSGLGVWDTLWEGKRSPIYDQLRGEIFEHYRDTYGEDSPQYRDALPGKSGHTNGKFEPQVVEKLITDMVQNEPNIELLTGYIPKSMVRRERLLESLTLGEFQGTRNVTIRAAVFADCSYEGDLLPLAKVSYRVGRESRAELGEPHAGRVYMKPTKHRRSTMPEELWRAHEKLELRKFSGFQELVLPESTGQSDRNVQALNYRTILTSDPANRIPIPKPAGCDGEFLRSLEFGSIVRPIPNQKIGWNRPQLVGLHQAYVEGDWQVRTQVMDAHWNAAMALLYFLQHDPSVDESTREYWQRYGLAKDEFTGNHHRPYEIYVREARRLEGRYTLSQHDLMPVPGTLHPPRHEDAIACSDWYMDSHAVTRSKVRGSLDEGKMMLHAETWPGQIPWRCLLPKDVDNLMVPICLSATHVAWGAIRLEPTWMQTGEAAGFAAAMAKQQGTTPGKLDAQRLVRALADHRFLLDFYEQP